MQDARTAISWLDTPLVLPSMFHREKWGSLARVVGIEDLGPTSTLCRLSETTERQLRQSIHQLTQQGQTPTEGFSTPMSCQLTLYAQGNNLQDRYQICGDAWDELCSPEELSVTADLDACNEPHWFLLKEARMEMMLRNPLFPLNGQKETHTCNNLGKCMDMMCKLHSKRVSNRVSTTQAVGTKRKHASMRAPTGYLTLYS